MVSKIAQVLNPSSQLKNASRMSHFFERSNAFGWHPDPISRNGGAEQVFFDFVFNKTLIDAQC